MQSGDSTEVSSGTPRGRPRKNPVKDMQSGDSAVENGLQEKRGRGRPRKPEWEKKTPIKSGLPRGRPRIYPPKDPNAPKRPRGRPRIHPPKVPSGSPRGRPRKSPVKMKFKVTVRNGSPSKKTGRGRPKKEVSGKKLKQRGRGRPRIHPPKVVDPNTPKKSRGRPRKSDVNGIVDSNEIKAEPMVEDGDDSKVNQNTPKKSRGRPRKSDVYDSVDSNESAAEPMVEDGEDSKDEVKGTKRKNPQKEADSSLPKKPRGRPKKSKGSPVKIIYVKVGKEEDSS